MATGNAYVGRKEAIGVGIEGTPGTAVAPQTWLYWTDQDLQNKTTVVENESALGVSYKVNSSAVVEKWAEGTIEGKVTSQGIGYLLLGFYGSVSTGAISGGLYPHTFSVLDSSVPTALTFTHYMPLKTYRHSYGVIDSLEISAEAGGWVMAKAAVKARTGASASDTPSFATESEFTSKHITVKTAANVAGLGAASDIAARSVKLSLERSSTAFYPLGDDDAPTFDREVIECKGELVVRYTDTQYEDDYIANTVRAMQLTLDNGTDDLTFTAPQVRFRELEKSSDKDGIVTQTIQFYCEFSTTTSDAVACVLNNDVATYEAA